MVIPESIFYQCETKSNVIVLFAKMLKANFPRHEK